MSWGQTVLVIILVAIFNAISNLALFFDFYWLKNILLYNDNVVYDEFSEPNNNTNNEYNEVIDTSLNMDSIPDNNDSLNDSDSISSQTQPINKGKGRELEPASTEHIKNSIDELKQELELDQAKKAKGEELTAINKKAYVDQGLDINQLASKRILLELAEEELNERQKNVAASTAINPTEAGPSNPKIINEEPKISRKLPTSIFVQGSDGKPREIFTSLPKESNETTPLISKSPINQYDPVSSNTINQIENDNKDCS